MTLPFPLFDSAEEFHSNQPGPVSTRAESQLADAVNQYTDANWASVYLLIANSFLNKYLQSNTNTFNRLRSEIERFSLWLVLKREKHPFEVNDRDILAYLKFLKTPDREWVAVRSTTRTIRVDGETRINSDWCPFWARAPKGERPPAFDPTLSRQQNAQLLADYHARVVAEHTVKTATLEAALRALSMYFNYLIEILEDGLSDLKYADISSVFRLEKHRFVNPVKKVKKTFRQQTSLDEESGAMGSAHCLTPRQWQFTLEAADEMRHNNPKRWTRAWFMVVFLKECYLRVSEISRTTIGIPRMSDIVYVRDRNRWLFIVQCGGRTARGVVLSEIALSTLKTYRHLRGLTTSLPASNDHSPLIAKLGERHKGSMSNNECTQASVSVGKACEDIYAVFKYTQSYIARQQVHHSTSLQNDIDALGEASPLWLRHTGAVMALERGVDIVTLQVDLGNRSPVTTHNHYIDLQDFAPASGWKRVKI